jgi:hypothetical protein
LAGLFACPSDLAAEPSGPAASPVPATPATGLATGAKQALNGLSEGVALLQAGSITESRDRLAATAQLASELDKAASAYVKAAEAEQQRCVGRIQELDRRSTTLFATQNATEVAINNLEAELAKSTGLHRLHSNEVEQLNRKIETAKKDLEECRAKIEELKNWWWVPGYGQYLAIRTLVDKDVVRQKTLIDTLNDRKKTLQQQSDWLLAAQQTFCDLTDEEKGLQVTTEALTCMRGATHEQNTKLRKMTTFLMDSQQFWDKLRSWAQITVPGRLRMLELLAQQSQSNVGRLEFTQHQILSQTATTLRAQLIEFGDSIDKNQNTLLQEPTDYCLLEEPATHCEGSPVPTGPVDTNRGMPASSFNRSCKDARIVDGKLHAKCRQRDGVERDTSIALRGIHNIDGVLRFSGPVGESSFLRSCDAPMVCGTTLIARCRKRDGTLNETSIPIAGIHNLAGNLSY